MESLRVPPSCPLAFRSREGGAWSVEELESTMGQRAWKMAVSSRQDKFLVETRDFQQRMTLSSPRGRAAYVGKLFYCCGTRGAPEPSRRCILQNGSKTRPRSLRRSRLDWGSAAPAKTGGLTRCGSFQKRLRAALWNIFRAEKRRYSRWQSEGNWLFQFEHHIATSARIKTLVASWILVSLLSTADVASVQAAAAVGVSTSSNGVGAQIEWTVGEEQGDGHSSHEEGVGSSKSTQCTTAVVEEEESGTEAVTNEELVQEAWEVVDEFFFDARHNSWSREAWLRTKAEVLKRPIRSKMAAYGIIRSMLSSLNDPYTRFLTPDQFSQLTKYDVTGIGMNVGEVPAEEGGAGTLKVLGLVIGSPAQQAGVRQGDELLSVNGTSVVGMSAFDVSSLIQGPKGTSVSIQLLRGPCSEPLEVTVTRQQTVRTPVFYRLQHSKQTGELVGYIQLREFNALAQRDLVTAMRRLEAGGATSLVLDLQDNPGGLVQAGIEVAKVFLDAGETVVETVGRDPTSQRTIAASGAPLTRVPLLVLVNDRTASASEIVSAALHDNCRALLVGRRTFGKGLIQSIYELSDGSGVILTVGKYVTPGHSDIDGRGIEPDFNRMPSLDQARLQLGMCKPSR